MPCHRILLGSASSTSTGTSTLCCTSITGASAGGALDDFISQAEVEKALPNLANSRAAGRAGLPAELLR